MNNVQETEGRIEVRVHGTADKPTLIYLPGLHGDWTLIGRFRRALGERVRFVEFTYPRTLTWSLDDYAANVETALASEGIHEGWVLGESFSSQVVWPLLQRNRFRVQGVILAGGFVRHPAIWLVRLAEKITGGISPRLITKVLFGYARLARARYSKAPEGAEEIRNFIARRTELDRQAAKHRLHLLAEHDACSVASKTSVPIYALTGAFDPIVPWFWVRRWLKKNCPALRDYKILWTADHNVLGTGVRDSARFVLEWIS